MAGRGRKALLALALSLGAGSAAAQPATGPGGRYEGTGVLLSGTGCSGSPGVPFPVFLIVSDGHARMPLRGGSRAIAGPVGADGRLDRMRWEGDPGVTDESSGRIADGRFMFDYVYDWPSLGAARCRYRYEGRRTG